MASVADVSATVTVPIGRFDLTTEDVARNLAH